MDLCINADRARIFFDQVSHSLSEIGVAPTFGGDLSVRRPVYAVKGRGRLIEPLAMVAMGKLCLRMKHRSCHLIISRRKTSGALKGEI